MQLPYQDRLLVAAVSHARRLGLVQALVCASPVGWAWLLASPLVLAQAPPSLPVSPLPVTAYAYDANGNLTRVVQGSAAMGGGFATASNFDRLQRLRNITDPLGGELSMEYNGRDQVTAIVDPRRLRTAYQRDGFGQTIRLSSPDTGASSQQFDSAGNLVMRTDARGVTEFRSHDALHRLTSLVYKSAGQADLVMAWRYDEAVAGSTFGKGRLTSTAYPGGGSRLGYDAWGRLISVIQTAQTATGTAARLQTQWQYDGAGNVVQLVYPSGRVVNVAHAAGKPLSVSLMGGLGGVERLLISGIQHEPFGAVRSWNWHHDAGVQRHERQFDTAGRMVRHTLGRLTRDLRYDAADRLVGVNHCCNASLAQGTSAFMLDQTFAYDNLGRLVSAAGVSGNWTYRYDANGNRTGTSVNGALRAWYPAKDSNRLLAAADPTRTFEHDASGNTAADWQNGSGWVAGHDLAGRLAVLTRTTPSVGAVGKTVQLSYTYNGQGQRVVRHRATSTACVPGASLCNGSAQSPEAVVFVYGQQGELLGEYRAADGAMLREYVWLGQIPVAVIAPQATLPGATTDIFHIHADHLNTPRLVLDTAGRQRWTWLSGEPFGATAANDNPEGFGAFTFNLRFPGQYLDQDSGLVYNHYRDFDPSLGRYTQSDPIGLAGGINTYSYVEGNPVSKIDPMGLETYLCRRPLDGFHGISVGPLYHQFVCTLDAKGKVNCGGLGPRGGSSGMFGGPGVIEQEASVRPEQCEKVRDLDQCFEKCVNDTLASPAPNYDVRAGRSWLFPSSNTQQCQVYAKSLLDKCSAQCRK